MNDFISQKIMRYILEHVETDGITIHNASGINKTLSEKTHHKEHRVEIKGKTFYAEFNIESFGTDILSPNDMRRPTLVFKVTDCTAKASEAFKEMTTILSDQYAVNRLTTSATNVGFNRFANSLNLPNINGISILRDISYSERRQINHYMHGCPLKREYRVHDEMMKTSFIQFEDIEIDSNLLLLIKEYFPEVLKTEGLFRAGLRFKNCTISRNCDWTILKSCSIAFQNMEVNIDDLAYSLNSFEFAYCKIIHSRLARLKQKNLSFRSCEVDFPRLFLTATAENLEKLSLSMGHDIERDLDNLKYFAPNLKELFIDRSKDFDNEGKIRDLDFVTGFKYLTAIRMIQFGYEHPHCMLVQFINPKEVAARYIDPKKPSAIYRGYKYIPFKDYETLFYQQLKDRKSGKKVKKLYADHLFDLEIGRVSTINSLYRAIYNTNRFITEKEMQELLTNYEGYVKSDDFLKTDGYYDYFIEGLILIEYKKGQFEVDTDIQLDWPFFSKPIQALDPGNLGYSVPWRIVTGHAINSISGIPIRLRIRKPKTQKVERVEFDENEKKYLGFDRYARQMLDQLAQEYEDWKQIRTDDSPFIVSFNLLRSDITSEFIEKNYPNLTNLIAQLKLCESIERTQSTQHMHLSSEINKLERKIISEIEEHLNVLTIPEIVYLMTRIERSKSKSRIPKYQRYNSILSRSTTKYDFSNITDESASKKLYPGFIDDINKLRILAHCRDEFLKNIEYRRVTIDDETAKELFYLPNYVKKRGNIKY